MSGLKEPSKIRQRFRRREVPFVLRLGHRERHPDLDIGPERDLSSHPVGPFGKRTKQSKRSAGKSGAIMVEDQPKLLSQLRQIRRNEIAMPAHAEYERRPGDIGSPGHGFFRLVAHRFLSINEGTKAQGTCCEIILGDFRLQFRKREPSSPDHDHAREHDSLAPVEFA
jgi:hypothetical protein